MADDGLEASIRIKLPTRESVPLFHHPSNFFPDARIETTFNAIGYICTENYVVVLLHHLVDQRSVDILGA